MGTTRKVLPARRKSVTQKVRVNGSSVHFTVGLYPDGTPGELWIDMAKQGAALRHWMGQFAMLFSLALQHEAPLETLVNNLIGSKSDPFGPVEGHDRITKCTSVMDCIGRHLAITYLGRDDLADKPPEAP